MNRWTEKQSGRQTDRHAGTQTETEKRSRETDKQMSRWREKEQRNSQSNRQAGTQTDRKKEQRNRHMSRKRAEKQTEGWTDNQAESGGRGTVGVEQVPAVCWQTDVCPAPQLWLPASDLPAPPAAWRWEWDDTLQASGSWNGDLHREGQCSTFSDQSPKITEQLCFTLTKVSRPQNNTVFWQRSQNDTVLLWHGPKVTKWHCFTLTWSQGHRATLK